MFRKFGLIAPSRTTDVVRFKVAIACIASTVVFAACGVLAQDVPEPAEMSTDEIESEIASIESEQQEIVEKLQFNIEQQEATQREYARLNQENERLDREDARLATVRSGLDADLAAIEKDRPAVQSACRGGTLPTQAEANAANARCEALIRPFNQRVDAYGIRLNAHKAELLTQKADEQKYNSDRDKAIKKEEIRAKEAQALIARGEYLDTRLAALELELGLRLRSAGAVPCESCAKMTSDEAASQCLMRCFEGARPGDDNAEAIAPDTGTPFFGEGAGRTADEAIEEYKNSGSANPGRRPPPPAEPPPPDQ